MDDSDLRKDYSYNSKGNKNSLTLSTPPFPI